MKNKKLLLLAGLLLATYCLFLPTAFAVDRLPAELKRQLLLKQFSQAVPQLKTLSAQGDNAARYQLALCYLKGDGVNKSVNQAIILLRKAALKGHSKASYLLGSMYYNGEDITQDISAAKSYLFIASQKNHRLAKKLLRQIDGMDSGTKWSQQEAQQSLEYAARNGDENRAADGLKNGARINQKNNQGSTPLIIASRNKQHQFIHWLLSKKPKLSITDNNNDTALHILATSADISLIDKLLKQGADFNLSNDNGRTPLINAVIAEKTEIVQLFLSHSANPHILDKQGKTAFDYANNKNNKKIISLLKPYINNKLKSAEQTQRLQQLKKQTREKNNLYFNWPLIAVAAAQNEPEVATMLMQQGADPWQQTPSGSSAISIAVSTNNRQLAVNLLSQYPLDTNAKINQALDLVTLAAKKDHFQLMADLTKMLPPTSATKEKFINTPLWHAIDNASEATSLQLIQWQQNDFRADQQGRNLLHLAVSKNLPQTVLALLNKGFDIHLSAGSQRTALWYAAELGHNKIMELLLSRKSNIHQADDNGHTPLLRAVISNHGKNILTAIKHGANVNTRTKNGNTALIFAADSKPSMIRLLLENSAEVSARNHLSLTPLMVAVKKKCLQCVDLLIKAGANPNRKNAQGNNSFDLAEGSAEIIKILDR